MEDSNAEVHESLERLYDLAARAFRIGRTPRELGEVLKESAQTVNNWAKGRGVSKQGALKAQEMYGWSASWIRDGVEPRLIGADDWQDGRYRVIQNKRIKVLGEITSEGDELRVHAFSDEERTEVMAITGGIPSHGYIVSTDALQPRYRMGETLIVADDVEPESGSDVMVWKRDKQVLVKQFIRKRDGLVFLSGLGGHDTLMLTLKTIDIKDMRPVLSCCGMQVLSPPEPPSG